jgi:hypothetical protein
MTNLKVRTNIYIFQWQHIVTCLTKGRPYYATFLSLLGNRNFAMDTLTTPVFLRCMVTNSWKASVSIVAGSVKVGKAIHASQSTSVRLRRQSVLAVSPRRDVSAVQFRQWDSRRHQCYSVHCNCNVCSCKSPWRINSVSNPNPRRVISHTTHAVYVTI